MSEYGFFVWWMTIKIFAKMDIPFSLMGIGGGGGGGGGGTL